MTRQEQIVAAAHRALRAAHRGKIYPEDAMKALLFGAVTMAVAIRMPVDEFVSMGAEMYGEVGNSGAREAYGDLVDHGVVAPKPVGEA